MSDSSSDESASPPRRFSRRRLLAAAAAGCVLGATGVGAYAFRIEPHWLRVVHREMPVRNLPGALAGRRIVQITDLHAGPLVDSDYLRRAMRRVGELSPDLVVITGDFMSYAGDWCIDEAVGVVGTIPPPPLGIVAVLGNHDYGDGWSDLRVADELSGRLADTGVRVLRNEVADVAGLHVAGIDDYWSPRFQPHRALDALDPSRANVVICHNPDAVDEPVWKNHRGWILSGHTHGGQCKPPFLPPPLLPVKNRLYTRGEFELAGGRTLYIGTGVGYLRRVRINVRPEITVFRLSRAA